MILKSSHLNLKLMDPRKWDQIGRGVEKKELGEVLPAWINLAGVVSVGSDVD